MGFPGRGLAPDVALCPPRCFAAVFSRGGMWSHLPLDTVGGTGLGVAIGSAVNLALGVPEA